jgi:UPF0755 protein
LKKIGLVVLIVLLLHAAWGVLLPGSFSLAEKTVDVPMHSGVIRIAYVLHREGVIRSPLYFRLLCKLTGTGGRLRAGEYVFSGTSNLLSVWAKIKNGQVQVHLVTLPEGFTAKQVAETLQKEGLIGQDEFLRCIQDKALLKKYGLPDAGAEGFLFPDTYGFVKGMSGTELAAMMVQRFFKMVTPEEIKKAGRNGFPLKRWVTLASIVEREAEAKEERSEVAAVFINRLNKKMRLESCATVLYAMGRIKARLSLNDLQFESPYNTYRHRGLTPGPICNPGKAALQAVLEPAKVPYLFFVAKGDGTHAFAVTMEEHLKNKKKYR